MERDARLPSIISNGTEIQSNPGGSILPNDFNGREGSFLAQVSNNPFFTAVTDQSSQLMDSVAKLGSGTGISWIRCSPCCCSERPSSWRKSTQEAATGRCGNQRQRRVIPMVSVLDDIAPASAIVQLYLSIYSYKRKSRRIIDVPVHARNAPPLY